MNQAPFRIIALLAALGFCPDSLWAEVKLASPFTSHMVLQRDAKVPVWGTAAPGEIVRVDFAGQEVVTTAGPDGSWRLHLKPLKMSAEGQSLSVSGSQTAFPLELTDVLVGEVWLASGQSNMDFSMSKKVKYFAGVAGEEVEIANADYPMIRIFTGTAMKAYTPQSSVGGEWQVCTPANAPAFSAVAYFFARDLQREINMPVGIITLAYGASTAESWIRREALVRDPALKPMVDHFDAAVTAFSTNPPAAVAPLRSEDVSATNAASAGHHRAAHAVRDPVQDQHNPTVLFNGMINPVIPYAIRGAIWYQGESIVGGAAGRALYPRVQATLVRDWRRLWGEGDFPFYIVQLAGQEAESNSPLVREAQATILQLPQTGMAVTSDIGEAKNVHPKDKQDVGDRLARIALANVKAYDSSIEFSGPVYQTMKIQGAKVELKFSHAEGMLAKGGPLYGFVIAGADLKFVPATAKITGSKIMVSSPDVAAPVAVRYAWMNYPVGCNLYNSASLPAVPFRTDAPKPSPLE